MATEGVPSVVCVREGEGSNEELVEAVKKDTIVASFKVDGVGL